MGANQLSGRLPAGLLEGSYSSEGELTSGLAQLTYLDLATNYLSGTRAREKEKSESRKCNKIFSRYCPPFCITIDYSLVRPMQTHSAGDLASTLIQM